MHLDRHHDKLTVRDETVIAHEEGSVVDVLEVRGEVTVRGDLRIRLLKTRARRVDLLDGRVVVEQLSDYGHANEAGEWVASKVLLPSGRFIGIEPGKTWGSKVVDLDHTPPTASA